MREGKESGMTPRFLAEHLEELLVEMITERLTC